MKHAIERMASAVAAAIVAASLASPALAESGDAARGRALAERFCAKCHAVAPGRTGPEPAVPSFMHMAADPEQTKGSLRQFIKLPHYEMEPQTLTSAEIEDVIAYILSLKR